MKHKITLLVSACLLSMCAHAAAKSTPGCNDLILKLQSKAGHHCALLPNTSSTRANYSRASYENIINLTPQPTSILLSPTVSQTFSIVNGVATPIYIYLPIESHLTYICDNRAESPTYLAISQDLKVGFIKPKAGAVYVNAFPANRAVFTTSTGHCGRKKYRKPGVVNVTIG